MARGGAGQNLEPTSGFEPATRCLQIRRRANSARDFSFPCIPRMSIESKELHSGGYTSGYKKPSAKRLLLANSGATLGFVTTYIWDLPVDP